MDHFEQYIKKHLENYEEVPPAELWQRIQSNIKPWYKHSWLKITTLVFFSVVMFLFLVYNNSNNSTELKSLRPSLLDGKQWELALPQIKYKDTLSKTALIYNGQNSSNVALDPKHVKLEQYNIKTTEPQIIDSQELTISQTNYSYIKHVDFSYNISPKQGCEPLTVDFSISAPDSMNISWFINKTLISTQSLFSQTFSAGIYYVQLVLYDTVQTIVVYDTIEVEPTPNAEFRISECQSNKPVDISNLSKGATCFIWIYGDGSQEQVDTPTHIYRSPGLYRLTLIAKNGQCVDTAQDLVVVNDHIEGIIFPNAFVPDVSGPNGGYYNPNKPDRSIFHPVVQKNIRSYTLDIYDRRGKLMFHTNDINQGWDGYYRNQLVPVGVYIYIAQGTFEDGEKFIKKGDITVIYR